MDKRCIDQNGIRIKISPMVIYICLVMAIYILPSLKVSVPYVVAGSIMLMTIPIVFIRGGEKKTINYIVTLLFLSGLKAVLGILAGSYSVVDGLNEAIREIRFFTPVIFASYALNNLPQRRLRQLIGVFTIILVFVMYKTSSALASDQWITRLLARSTSLDTPELRAYRLQNVGGFEYSYMIGAVIICLVWIALNASKKHLKILCTIAAVICFAYIIQTMYTTLLLVTSLCMLLVILSNIKNRYIKVICIVMFIISVYFLPILFGFLSSLFTDSLLSTRFLQLQEAMKGGGINALGPRPELMLFALNSWLKHPIFGGPAKNVSSHSLVASTLVLNGIIGLAIDVVILIQAYKVLMLEIRECEVGHYLLKISFLYVILLSVLNPIGYVFEITITTFFIVPLCVAVVDSGNICGREKLCK